MDDKSYSKSDMMTALCLMDALCDYEHSAGYLRGLREGNPDARPTTVGDRLGDYRSNHGSYDLRQQVIRMTPLVDDVWDNHLSADDYRPEDVGLSFDFEYCPLSVRLYFENPDDSAEEFQRKLVTETRVEVARQREIMDRQRADHVKRIALTDAERALETAAAALKHAEAALAAAKGA
jgi:hypothetical protein